MESHSSFCSPFSPAEFLVATSNLSSFTATGPYKVAYLMLKHLPHSGMGFLLHIFNLSWSSHSFPSIWKTSSIIPIHKTGKPLHSPASFQPMLPSGLSMIFQPLCLLPSAALFTLTIWPFGLPPPRSPLRWRPHKELCFDWSAGLSTGVFLSIRANVRPFCSQWIPTRLTSNPTSSYSAPASVSIPLQL